MPCESFSFPFIPGNPCNSLSYSLWKSHISLSLSYFPVLSKMIFVFRSHSLQKQEEGEERRFMCPTFMYQSSLLYYPYHHCYLHPGISVLSVCWELVPFPIQMHYEASVICFYFVLLHSNPKSLALSTTLHILITQSFLLLWRTSPIWTTDW